MVKRLRHHPFTVVSRVRISVGSPKASLPGLWRARAEHLAAKREDNVRKIKNLKTKDTAGRSPRTYKNSFCFMEV